MPWHCPDCGRRFGRANQSHECKPALTLEAYLERQPEARRDTYRAVLELLEEIGEVDVDPVEVGILLKRARTFCELRPRRDAVELCFKLSRPVAAPRIRKTIQSSAHRTAHFVHLRSADEVDEEIRGWLAESWLDSPE